MGVESFEWGARANGYNCRDRADLKRGSFGRQRGFVRGFVALGSVGGEIEIMAKCS